MKSLRSAVSAADAPTRARGLGVPFEGAPGPNNAITDVAGVEVGQITHVSGEGPLKVGAGPIRTGVTVVLPRGRASAASVALVAAQTMTGADGYRCYSLPHAQLRAILKRYGRLEGGRAP
jgi:L-aminopeptidase/D-esterase-like protein